MSPSASLLSVTTKLARESDRANAAERRSILLASQLHSLSDQHDALQLQLDKTQKELDLYRIQLDLAQQEIDRAQEIVTRVDRARLQAEEDAARYRTRVRELIEKAAISDALRQGRDIGFNEGLETGRALAQAELKSRHTVSDHWDGRRSSQSATRAPSSARHATESRRRHTDATNVLPVRSPSVVHRRMNNDTPISARPRSSSVQQPHPVHPSENPDLHNISHRNVTPSVTRPMYQIPPDGYIPTMAAGSVISLPPPHEFTRPISPTPTVDQPSIIRVRPMGNRPGSVPSNDARQSSAVRNQDSVYGHGLVESASTLSGGSRSTNISQYEFVRPPQTPEVLSPLPEQISQQWRSAVSDLQDITDRDNAHASGLATEGRRQGEPPTGVRPLPEIPTGLLNVASVHQPLSRSNSPAIYRRPLRDEIETEKPISVVIPSRRQSRANSDGNVGINVISAVR
ncbi:hypothetical protein AX15_000354 [Amanita polypyramis BW_CC]|nr:hypothetical protein AX15_000354 [Amanita polypyramis BW_CC]